MRFAWSSFFVGALVIWPVDASASDSLAAREQLKIGYLLAQEGKCAEAIPHLQESVRLDRKAIALINLAQCEEKVGHLADAMSHWVDAHARAEAEGATAIQEEADKRAAALEPRLPKLAIVLATGTPKDVTVVRDGAVLGPASLGVSLPVDPGMHTIVVKATGRADETKNIRLEEGESRRIEVSAGSIKADAVVVAPSSAEARPTKPPAESSGGRISPLVWIGFGVGVPALAVGSVTGLLAAGSADDAKRDCPSGVCTSPSAVDAAESGKMMGTVSTVAFIVGAAGVGLGVYGLLSPGKGTSSASARIDLVPGGATLRGRF